MFIYESKNVEYINSFEYNMYGKKEPGFKLISEWIVRFRGLNKELNNTI